MSDWASIAKARGLDIPSADIERFANSLDALEESLRALAADLPPALEPAAAFSAEEDNA